MLMFLQSLCSLEAKKQQKTTSEAETRLKSNRKMNTNQKLQTKKAENNNQMSECFSFKATTEASSENFDSEVEKTHFWKETLELQDILAAC